MKKLFSFLLIAVLLLGLSFPAFAAESDARVFDYAELLTDSEEASLQQQIEQVQSELGIDVVILLVNDLPESYTAAGGSFNDDAYVDSILQAYSDDYFDYNGFGVGEERSGCLFLLSMTWRGWHISTRGSCLVNMNDYDIQFIGRDVIDALNTYGYAQAMSVFVDEVDRYNTVSSYDGDDSYYYNPDKYVPSSPPWGKFGITGLIAGLFVALISTGSMKKKLKTVESQNNATVYARENSLNITEHADVFLYSHVNRTAKPQQQTRSGGGSSHISSSGASHGGGGGRF